MKEQPEIIHNLRNAVIAAAVPKSIHNKGRCVAIDYTYKNVGGSPMRLTGQADTRLAPARRSPRCISSGGM